MRYLGTIAHLQIQRGSPKVGEKPRRHFDPSPLYSVDALTVGPEGATAQVDGVETLDVHHRDHPSGKNALVNGLSIGFTEHYRAMRERFGDYLTDGVAGENILIEADGLVREDDLRGGLTIETRDGKRAHLRNIMVAEPCVEYTRYALRWPRDLPSDRTVTEGLQFLRDGMRAFYATCDAGPVSVRLRDRVYLV